MEYKQIVRDREGEKKSWEERKDLLCTQWDWDTMTMMYILHPYSCIWFRGNEPRSRSLKGRHICYLDVIPPPFEWEKLFCAPSEEQGMTSACNRFSSLLPALLSALLLIHGLLQLPREPGERDRRGMCSSWNAKSYCRTLPLILTQLYFFNWS